MNLKIRKIAGIILSAAGIILLLAGAATILLYRFAPERFVLMTAHLYGLLLLAATHPVECAGCGIVLLLGGLLLAINPNSAEEEETDREQERDPFQNYRPAREPAVFSSSFFSSTQSVENEDSSHGPDFQRFPAPKAEKLFSDASRSLNGSNHIASIDPIATGDSILPQIAPWEKNNEPH